MNNEDILSRIHESKTIYCKVGLSGQHTTGSEYIKNLIDNDIGPRQLGVLVTIIIHEVYGLCDHIN